MAPFSERRDILGSSLEIGWIFSPIAASADNIKWKFERDEEKKETRMSSEKIFIGRGKFSIGGSNTLTFILRDEEESKIYVNIRKNRRYGPDDCLGGHHEASPRQRG